ncbi:MAG TPA: type II toxin-antitoxin system VapB family antitoxin [Acidimicrobiales bacterium]|nr:type II toxin-antitoxin system VapB family antitoxin [Acidimicrobiales bacterium]
MARIRVSTTVDDATLAEARRVTSAPTDAALFDEALRALLARRRSAEIDNEYARYEEHPLEEPDAWGDLDAFRTAAASG